LAIARDGWVRTAVELPPDTTADSITSVELRCLVAPPTKNEPLAHSGLCRVEKVSKAFLLGQNYAPGKSFWKLDEPVMLSSGQSAVFQP
jgi:hypothetical protein